MGIPESAANFLARQRRRLQALRAAPRLVFAEGDDERVLAAAAQLAGEGLLEPILIGSAPPRSSAGARFLQPAASPLLERYARLLWERRRAQGLSELEAREEAAQPLQFAALMLAGGDADVLLAGTVHPTAEVLRALSRAVEMRPEFRRPSSAHLLAVHNRSFGHDGLIVFADAAVLIQPSAAELAEIAMATAETTRLVLEVEPLIALLSFSTKGSARHREVDKVVEALRYLRARAPELRVDGELQADAALLPAAAASKAPGSGVAGRANTLIFPDLHSANIGCKLVERLGDAALLAVVLQGFRRPANIVSRGCSVQDLVHTAIVAAVQAAAANSAGT